MLGYQQRFLTFSNAVILFVIAVGGYLRFRGIGDFSLWEDELYSVGTATQSGPWYGPVVTGQNMEQLKLSDSFWSWKLADPHPPLYEMLLVPWIALWGVSDFAIRSLSAVLGVVTLFSVYALPRSMGWSVRLVYVLLLAFSGGLLIYSQDSRNYALGICLVAWMLAWLLREMERAPAALEAGRPHVLLLVLGSLLALTHYYGVLFVAGIAVYTVSRVRTRAAFWRASLRWLLAMVPVLIYIGLGWMGVLTKLKAAPPQGLSLAMTFKRNVIGFLRNFDPGTAGTGAFWVFMLLALAGLAIYFVMRARQHPLQQAAGVVAAINVLFFMALVLGTRRAEFFSERYVLFMVPGCLLLVAIFMQVRGWPRILSLLLVVFLVPAGLKVWQKSPRPQNGGDWRGAAALVAKVYKPGDLIVNPLNDPTMRSHFQHYLRNHVSQAELDRRMWSITRFDNLGERLRAAGGPPEHLIIYSHLAFPGRIEATLDVLRSQFYCHLGEPQRAQALLVMEVTCPR